MGVPFELGHFLDAAIAAEEHGFVEEHEGAFRLTEKGCEVSGLPPDAPVVDALPSLAGHLLPPLKSRQHALAAKLAVKRGELKRIDKTKRELERELDRIDAAVVEVYGAIDGEIE